MLENSTTKNLLTFSLLLSCLLLTACSGSKPTNLGATDGQLLPCPTSPNCVNSRSNNVEHAIKPLRFKQPMTQTDAIAAVKAALLTLPRVEVIEESSSYLYAEATSKIMRYVDDVEFLFPEQGEILEVHLRSASRLGYKDFNVNRERIELIRAALIEQGLGIRE